MDNNNKMNVPPANGQQPPVTQNVLQGSAKNTAGAVYYPPRTYVKSIKTYKPLDKKDTIFCIIFAVLSFLFVDFALFENFHLGFTIFYFLLFIASTVYLYSKENRVNIFSVFCGVLSLAGSISFSLYNDHFINTILFFLIGGLYILYCIGISDSFSRKPGSFKIGFDLAAAAFVTPFTSMSDFVGSVKAGNAKGKRSFFGLIGFIVAIPVVVVLVVLLSKSDAAFEGLVSTVIKNIAVYLVQIVIAILFFPYLFGLVFSKKRKTGKKEKGSSASSMQIVPESACVSFLSAISVVYVVYLFSQTAYFFSAFKGLLPEGYSYSASTFARRGFFEMFAICIINLIVISLVTLLAKKKENKKSNMAIKILSGFISVFTVVLLITALQKMRLNISIYGLSKNRLMVTVFMIMLFVIIAFFMVHIFSPKTSYMQPIILVCSAIFIALSFADVDAQIAKYNIQAYESGKIESLDVETIGNLSDSTIKYIIELAASDNPDISTQAVRILTNKINDADGCLEYSYADNLKFVEDKLEYTPDNDFRSFNLAKHSAAAAIYEYYNSLDKKGQKLFLNINSFEKGDYEFDREANEYIQYNDDNRADYYAYNSEKCIYEFSRNESVADNENQYEELYEEQYEY